MFSAETMIMKNVTLLLSLFLVINACGTIDAPTSINPEISSDNCPEPSQDLSPVPTSEGYEGFNYNVFDIIPSADTVRFQTSNYDFVFCRGNSNWTVQASTLERLEDQNYEEFLAELANPEYESIEFNGETYQYRILLDPNPFPDFSQEAQRVIFEWITPETDSPQSQVLYTLEEVKQAETGFQLGVPEISGVQTGHGQIFWSISPEQGEGNGGIATIVSYNPNSDSLEVIQPPEIQGQQITDLALTPDSSSPLLWFGTQMSAEGTPYIPTSGLVSYNLDTEVIQSYPIEDNPLVGAIPFQLELEDDILWVGTGNGICQVDWQNINVNQSWSCWRVAMIADVPPSGLPLYESLQASTPTENWQPNQVEVLWWLRQDYETNQGRYEVVYPQGFQTTIEDTFALEEWRWNGNRFVRGFEEVQLNYVGGGPVGIGSHQLSAEESPDVKAIRGDLSLLEAMPNSVTLTYYSGWVDDDLLRPIPTLVPYQPVESSQRNPLF